MRRWSLSKEMRVVCVILSVATIAEAGFLETNITRKDNLLTKSMKKYLTEKYSDRKLKICTNLFLKKMAKYQEIEKNNEWQEYMPYGIHIQFSNLKAAENLKKRFDKKIDGKVKKALANDKYKPKTLGVGCGAHVRNDLPTCYMYLGIKANTCSIKI